MRGARAKPVDIAATASQGRPMATGKAAGRTVPGEQLHTAVANELGRQIVAGAYAAGDRLPGEMAAGARFGVSRPAYREAIRMLAAKGLVESRPKAGTHVCRRDCWNLLDPDVLHWLLSSDGGRSARQLLELRAMLEPAAASVAAVRRGPADLAAMSAALVAMAATEPDSPGGQEADRRFHEAMFAATSNDLVARLAQLVATSVDFVAEYKRERHVDRDPRPDHEALYAAIAGQKADEAYAIMQNLLKHAEVDIGDGR